MSIVERLTAALSDRYRLERELGRGGMATVYLAADLKHDRKVAIKVLKPELAAVLGAERFIVEIKTTAALQHPHILPLFDSGEADGFLYYVMPYIDGETLRARMTREQQPPVDEVLRLVGLLAAGNARPAFQRAAGENEDRGGQIVAMTLDFTYDRSPNVGPATSPWRGGLNRSGVSQPVAGRTDRHDVAARARRVGLRRP